MTHIHHHASIALLGSGTVGQAVLGRLAGLPALRLVHAANRRTALADPQGLDPIEARGRLNRTPHGSTPPTLDPCDSLGDAGPRILIDATACGLVAERHRDLLERGIHVVTACKLARGTSLARWRDIEAACRSGRSRFGERATVGAGLPLLSSIQALRAGGDRIHAIAGVMSGSLAWLFDRYDGSQPFSALVRQALADGYTEPDPREDLSGEDVRRKLLILARAAGQELDEADIDVGSLVPPDLARLGAAKALSRLDLLDAPIASLFADAQASGRSLRFVARWQAGVAKAGLEALAPNDPLAGGGGTDNRVAIWSDRYCDQPLVIQGPGAGADVTAAALIDDVLAIVRAGEAGRLAA